MLVKMSAACQPLSLKTIHPRSHFSTEPFLSIL